MSRPAVSASVSNPGVTSVEVELERYLLGLPMSNIYQIPDITSCQIRTGEAVRVRHLQQNAVLYCAVLRCAVLRCAVCI